MDFNAMIKKVVTEAENVGNKPFIVFRDSENEWQCDFTQNQHGEPCEWLDDANATDPFAVTFTGEDFSYDSQAYVYDKVLMARLHAEYKTEGFGNGNEQEADAFMKFLDDNIRNISTEVTDHLMGLDRPLAALYELNPISLKDSDSNLGYDESKAQEVIDIIEDNVLSDIEGSGMQMGGVE